MTPVTLDVRRAEARPLRGDGPQHVTARRAPRRLRRSLEGDGGAGALEGRLCLLCCFLVHALQDRLRCAVDQVLCLLEAEAGEGAHLLDDLDLLLACGLENDVELRLLLLGLKEAKDPAGAAAATGAAAVTSKTSSNFFTNSESSIRVSSLNASMSSSVVSFFAMVAFLPGMPLS